MRTSLIAVALLALPLGADAAEDVKTRPHLEAIRSVAKEGAGHEAAARAWSELVQADAAQLPEILAGIDGANPLAANWLVLAAQTVVQRERDAGRALPCDALETFLRDRRHAPRARYVAYTWLVEARPPMQRRLLADMLDDPSLDLRRQAVAQVLGDAIQVEELSDAEEAVPLWRRALAAARDPDQVEEIAARLRKAGEKVDLQRHFGFLTRWHVIGPFDNTDGTGYAAAYPPENEMDLEAAYAGKHGRVKWVEHSTDHDLGKIDLNKVLVEEKDVAGYAVTEFVAAAAREVQLRLTSYNAVKLWLNGRQVAGHEVYHSGSQLDQYVAPVALKKGKNVILVKICQNNIQQEWARHWGFQLRVCDDQGTAVLPAESGSAEGPGWGPRPRRGVPVRFASRSAAAPRAGSGQVESRVLSPSDCWLHFRGTDNNPVAASARLPLRFGPEENVTWKVPLPGRGPAGPVVVGDRVFVTASDGPREDRLHVLCLDAGSGKTRWHRWFWATGSTVCHPFGAVAAPTPASDGRLVLAFFSSNDLVCLDLEGNLQWLRGLAYERPATRNDVGMASSPLVLGQTVIVQCQTYGDSFAAGLDIASGRNRWWLDREKGSLWASPTIFRARPDAEPLALLQSRRGLAAVVPHSGEVVWEHEAGCHSMASVVAADGRIYLPAGGLEALEISGGVPRLLWRQQRLVCGAGSPVVHQGRVYTVNSAGVVCCGDVATGERLWQLRLEGKGRVWATPVLAGGHLYVIKHDGRVEVVQLGEKGQQVGSGQIDPGALATPAIAGGAIYFRTDEHLWKVASPQGEASP